MKFSLCVALVLVLIVPGVAWPEEIKQDSFNKLMALSGLQKQVAEFPGMVRLGVEHAREQGTPIPSAEFHEVMSSIDGAFQPSEILTAIGIQAKGSISESEARDLLAWYESDIGMQITKAEEAASTPAAYQEMIRNARALLSDRTRVEIAKKLDDLLNATDMAMQLQEDAGTAVFIAVSKIMNPEQPVQLDAFKSHIREQEEQIRKNVHLLVIVSYVYSYKDVEIASLEKYVDFNKRPNTRRFNDSVARGMQYALDKSIDRMTNSLTVNLKK